MITKFDALSLPEIETRLYKEIRSFIRGRAGLDFTGLQGQLAQKTQTSNLYEVMKAKHKDFFAMHSHLLMLEDKKQGKGSEAKVFDINAAPFRHEHIRTFAEVSQSLQAAEQKGARIQCKFSQWGKTMRHIAANVPSDPHFDKCRAALLAESKYLPSH